MEYQLARHEWMEEEDVQPLLLQDYWSRVEKPDAWIVTATAAQHDTPDNIEIDLRTSNNIEIDLHTTSIRSSVEYCPPRNDEEKHIGIAQETGIMKIVDITTHEHWYACQICDKPFKNIAGVKIHITKKHVGREVSIDGGEPRRKHRENPTQCTVCERTFSGQTALKHHMFKHTGRKQTKLFDKACMIQKSQN